MKIYISGPISKTYFPATRRRFQSMEKLLEQAGYQPVNPISLNDQSKTDYLYSMLVDIRTLSSCDAIIMLKGWINSIGCRNEFNVARHLGLLILYESFISDPGGSPGRVPISFEEHLQPAAVGQQQFQQ